MRNSIMTMLAVVTAIAGGSAAADAQSSYGMKSPGYNWNVTISGAQTTMSATVTIYDTLFNALTTDCLPPGTTRTYSGAYPAPSGAGLYIRYQLYGASTCAGAELLDTSYGPELTGDEGMFPMQTVPAAVVTTAGTATSPSGSPSGSRTSPSGGTGILRQ